MSKFLDKIFKVIDYLMAIMFACMIAMVLFNVILRYFFNSGITWSEEMSRYLFVWIVYIGFIGAMRNNSHLAVDVFFNKLPKGLKKIVYVLGQILIIVIMGMLFKGSLDITILNIGAKAAATGVPYVLVYGVGILASVCIMINSLYNIYSLVILSNPLEEVTRKRED
ncbi:TRAP transporter small permease [Brachyspira pilosicoli]|uniref:TRAP transporter small permease n=1 Tax=Brachyspira pilosicoli TaxID=52584 RepID=UPI0012F4E732|nr:TRAP transporter small permease [Brachyspira pilosicoli]